MDRVYRVLQFLRIVDDQRNLSLTNIALMAVLARLLVSPTIDMESLLGLVATLVSYQAKRVVAGVAGTPAADEAEELKKIVETLQTKVTAMELGQQRRFARASGGDGVFVLKFIGPFLRPTGLLVSVLTPRMCSPLKSLPETVRSVFGIYHRLSCVRRGSASL